MFSATQHYIMSPTFKTSCGPREPTESSLAGKAAIGPTLHVGGWALVFSGVYAAFYPVPMPLILSILWSLTVWRQNVQIKMAIKVDYVGIYKVDVGI